MRPYKFETSGKTRLEQDLLGEKEVLNLLLETLKEEKNCDKDLTKLAKSEINFKAK